MSDDDDDDYSGLLSGCDYDDSYPHIDSHIGPNIDPHIDSHIDPHIDSQIDPRESAHRLRTQKETNPG